MKINNFKPFKGQHCETTAVGCLLNRINIELSEPMLFGIGEGLGYIFWQMKSMDFPFIGGRVKTDLLTENICRNLNLKLEVFETSSVKKVWTNVATQLEAGKAVGLKLDCYHLDYFSNKIHFAGHYATMYGYDDAYAYLVDTDQQGGQVRASLANLELARNERGPMSSRNRSFTISKNESSYQLEDVIKKAIHNNATEFLNPPIKNITYLGMLKTSSQLKKWFLNSNDIKGDFETSAMLMERAGTGGSLFRNLYRDFLKESAELLGSKSIEECYHNYTEIATLWREVSQLFDQVGKTADIKYIHQASDILVDLSNREKGTMEKLRVASLIN